MDSRERANQASAILNNPVFKDTLERLSNDLISQWSIAEERQERELCWMKLNALRSIQEDLEAPIHSDKIENTER